MNGRQGEGRGVHQQSGRGAGYDDSEDPAADSQNDALTDEQANDLGAGRTQGRTDRELARAAHGASQHEASEIQASEKKHGGYRTHHGEETAAHLADQDVLQFPYLEIVQGVPVVEPFLVVGELSVKRRLERMETLLHLIERNTGPEARNHLVVVAFISRVFRAQLQRQPDIGSSEYTRGRLGGCGKACRHHANHGEGLLVDADSAADNRWIAGKDAGP